MADSVTERRGSGSSRGYLPALDGLRAVAVAAVVAFHLGHLPGGFLGVDIFFVISGFLITGLLLAEWERNGTIGLRAFWKRRFRRLLPALFVVLVAVAFAAKAWLPAWRLTDIRNDALSAMAYVANWRFSWSGQSYFAQGAGPSPLRHTWSLAIEEQFYVLWPLLVVGVLVLSRRLTSGSRWDGRRLVGLLAAVLGLGSAVWMAVASASDMELSRVYYGTDTRVFALCAGAWLASWWEPWIVAPRAPETRRRRSQTCARAAVGALGVLAVLVVVVAEDNPASYRWAFQLAAVASAVVVAGLATGEGGATGALGAAPMRWIGRRSYGIYLWSWPIQIFAQERLNLGPWELAAVVVAGAVVLAALSFALVEEPIRTGRFGQGEDPWLPSWSLGGVAIIAVVVAVTLPAAGAPKAPSYLRTSDKEALAIALAPPTRRLPVDSSTTTSVVVVGAPGPLPASAPLVVPADATVDPAAPFGRPLRVLVTGDSVAWSLGISLGDKATVPVEVDGRGIIGCGLMPASATWIAGDRRPAVYADTCENQAEAERLGLEGQPDVAMLWTGAWEIYDHEYNGQTYRVGTKRFATLLEGLLQERVDRYRSAGVVTVLPLLTCFGPSAFYLGTERQDPERLAWVNERLTAVAQRNPGWVRMIDPNPVLCNPDGTFRETMPNGLGIRVDGAHFDDNSAPWFWNTWLASQLAAAFS